MKKLKLKQGDKVTISKIWKDHKTISTHTVSSIENFNKNNNFYLIIGSKMHTYLELTGVLPTKLHKKKVLKIFPKLSQRKYYSTIELLEVQKAHKWYTSILNKFRFFRNKRK